ncbi:MAG: hypothetical protein H7Z42_22365 [Roseiflexaceae bacterium]|nr:hypothetical protein [Roseiflexaceae bacterium]
MTQLHDPFLNEIRDQIRVTDIEYPKEWEHFLKSFGLPLVEGQVIHRLIDWSRISEKYETRYDLLTKEREIATALAKSPLSAHADLLMDFGFQSPVIGVPVSVFIANWFTFIKNTLFMGTVVITNDGSLFMEFTDDADFLLISNFPIVSDT